MINHRLLKAVIKGETAERPQAEATVQMAERRRLNRMAERDVGDWLYARFCRIKPVPKPDLAPRLSISAVAACVFVWWITVPLRLSRHRSCMQYAMN
jgi:hypothetical protein